MNNRYIVQVACAVCVIFLVWATVKVIVLLRKFASKGECMRCGYDLRLGNGICPECGWASIRASKLVFLKTRAVAPIVLYAIAFGIGFGGVLINKYSWPLCVPTSVIDSIYQSDLEHAKALFGSCLAGSIDLDEYERALVAIHCKKIARAGSLRRRDIDAILVALVQCQRQGILAIEVIEIVSRQYARDDNTRVVVLTCALEMDASHDDKVVDSIAQMVSESESPAVWLVGMKFVMGCRVRDEEKICALVARAYVVAKESDGLRRLREIIDLHPKVKQAMLRRSVGSSNDLDRDVAEWLSSTPN